MDYESAKRSAVRGDNRQRARQALDALRLYVDVDVEGEIAWAARHLLRDLRHLCRKYGLSYQELDFLASREYSAQVREEYP